MDKPTQVKKNPNDPNIEDINPEIIRLARGNGFIRQPFELFLIGQLTWMEALETIILLLAKEYHAQGKLLVDTLTDKGPSRSLMLSPDAGHLLKALPPHPIKNEAEKATVPQAAAATEATPAGYP